MAWTGKDLSGFGRDQDKQVENAMKLASMLLIESLTFITPVDTGRARSNWIVTTGEPSRGIIPDSQIDKQGSASKSSADSAQPKIGVGFYISNNLPYIEYLENGTDNMAPYNMVKRSIQDTARRLQMEVNR